MTSVAWAAVCPGARGQGTRAERGCLLSGPARGGDRCVSSPCSLVFWRDPGTAGARTGAIIWLCFPGYLSCCRFLDDNQIVTSSGDTTW